MSVANPFDDSALLAGLSEDSFREATLGECPVCLEVPAHAFLSPCCRQVFCAPHLFACADCPCCRHPRNWACPHCTLINTDFASACTACATAFVALGSPSAPPAPRLARATSPPPRLSVRRSSSNGSATAAAGRAPPLSPVVPALHNHPTSPLATIAEGTVLARAAGVGGGLFSSSPYRPAQWSLDHVGLQLIFVTATPTGHRRPSASSIRRVLIHAFMACVAVNARANETTRSFSQVRPSRAGGTVTCRFVENPKGEVPSVAPNRFSARRTIRTLFDFAGDEAGVMRLVAAVEALIRRKMHEGRR